MSTFSMMQTATVDFAVSERRGLVVERIETDSGAPIIAVTWRQDDATHLIDMTLAEAHALMRDMRDAINGRS